MVNINLDDKKNLLHNLANLNKLNEDELLEFYKTYLDKGYILNPIWTIINYLNNLNNYNYFLIDNEDFNNIIELLDNKEQQQKFANMIAIAYFKTKKEISEKFYWDIRKHSSFLIEYWGYLFILHYELKDNSYMKTIDISKPNREDIKKEIDSYLDN